MNSEKTQRGLTNILLLDSPLRENRGGLLLGDADRENQVARTDVVDHLDAFDHAAEAGVHAVEVLRVLAVQADEELRAARVLAAVGHREYAAVVALARCRGFARDGVARAARPVACGAAALNDEIGNDAVERQSVVKALLRQFHEIGDREGRLFFVKFRFQVALFGRDQCIFHSVERFCHRSFLRRKRRKGSFSTPKKASPNMPPLIFETPRRRSVKTIGTSAIFIPSRHAVYFISI